MSGFPAGVDSLGNPIPDDPFSLSNGLPSTQYFIRANAALVALENTALQRTSPKLVMADGFTTQPEVLISDAESLTNWAGTGIHDAAVLDATYFTRGTQSVHVSLNETTAGAKYCFNVPAPAAAGAHLFAAIDLRWQHIGGAGGDPSFYSVVIASGANLTGTTSVVALGARPQGVFSTVIIPVGSVTTIGSIGILATSVSALAPPAWTHFWIDNARLKAQTSVETALGSGTQMGVIVPPSVAAATAPRLLDAAETVLDMRPSSAILGGHAGIRHAREWGIIEDGTVEVSTELQTIFNSLPSGTILQLSPAGKYWCAGTLQLSRTDNTLDANGATIFSAPVKRTANLAAGESDHAVEIIGNGIAVRRAHITGYRSDTYLGSALTTLAGTPTVVGSGVQLNAAAESVRLPKITLDGFTETPYYFRNRDGNFRFEATIWINSASADATDANMVLSDDAVGTVISTRACKLTTTPTLFSILVRGDKWIGSRLRLAITKATATANVITVDSVTAYNTVAYRSTTALSSGINILGASGVLIADCEIEGAEGDGITINDSVGSIVRDTEIRGTSRNGVFIEDGTDITLQNVGCREVGASSFAIDPVVSTDTTLRVTVKNCRSINARKWALDMTDWTRNTNPFIERFDSDGAGLGMLYGGGHYSSIHNVTHRNTFRTQSDRVGQGATPNADCIFIGRNSHLSGITTDMGIHLVASGAAAGNKLGTFKILEAPFDSGSVIIDAPRSSITSGSTGIDTQATAITWPAGASIGQARMAADAQYSALDLGQLHARYPNTYKGLAFSSVWIPGGHNVLDEPVYNVRGISGTLTRPNNLGATAVAVTPSLPAGTPMNITFPTQATPAFASVTTPTPTTGGTMTAGTYYYRVAPCGLYGGPAAALAETAGVVLSGGNNAVNIPINRWAVDTDAQVAGVTIWRGTTPGTYTRRYDVKPNAAFYAIQQDVATFTDIGTALVVPTSAWGYPASVGASAGPLTVANESGWEPDALYGVAVETSWATSVGVSSKGPDGFTLTFGTNAPAGSPTISWLLFR